jgi:hypothetical protein
VTDGGAKENLSLVSALYALRGTISQFPQDAPLSDIHVLVFEASSLDYDYRDDRGVGVNTGGSQERITAGLTQALIAELGKLVNSHGGTLRLHYLPLPVAFRPRGPFGTNWQFARTIGVTNPLLANTHWRYSILGGPDIDYVELDGSEVLVAWRALFDPRQPLCSRAERFLQDPKSAPPSWTRDVQLVSRWLCGRDDRRAIPPLLPDYQVEAWATVVRELGKLQ